MDRISFSWADIEGLLALLNNQRLGIPILIYRVSL